MKTFTHFLLLIGLPINLIAQDFILNCHQLSSEQGLSESTNDFLYVDHMNLTWIGTLNGIDQFDGKEVISYNERSGLGMLGFDIQSPIFEDTNGNIWFTTAKAINKFNRRTGTFEAGLPIGQNFEENINPYAFFLEQERYLWIIIDQALFRLDTQGHPSQELEPIFEGFHAIRANAEVDSTGKVTRIFGALWVQEGVEIVDFSNGQVSLKHCKEGPHTDKLFRQVLSNINGKTYLLSPGGIVTIQLDELGQINESFTPAPSNFPRLDYMCQVEDQLLVSNKTGDIALFDLGKDCFSKQRMRAFDLDQKKYIGDISEIFLGRDSILWMEVKGEGVYYANLRKLDLYSLFLKNQIEESSISHLFELDDGEILAVDPNGRGFIFDSLGNFKLEIEVPRSLKILRAGDGSIWSISREGFSEGAPFLSNFQVKVPFQITRNIFDFIQIDKNRFLLATINGLASYKTSTEEFQFIQQKDIFNKIFVDTKGRIWTSTIDGEIQIWKLKVNADNLQLLEKIPNEGIVNDIAEDIHRGVIYVGTSQGLLEIKSDLNKVKFHDFKQIESSRFIRSILIDSTAVIWLGTNNGILKFEKRIGEGPYNLITRRDGLSNNEFNKNAKLVTKSGTLLFGSVGGVDLLKPKLNRIALITIAKIKDLKIHEKPYRGDTLIGNKKKLVLKFNENTLTFKFQAPEYTDGLRVPIKVRLYHKNGVDSNLIKGTENTYTYTNLPFGKYRFEYASQNKDGMWQPQNSKLNILIKPPFYLSTWFIVLVSVLGFVATILFTRFFYIYRLRTQQLKVERQERIIEREKQRLEKMEALQVERDRIAQELHDELNGGLSSIQIACARADRYNESPRIEKSLKVISKKTTELLKTKEHLIWAMSPESSSVKELVAQIRFHAATYFDDNQIPIHFDISSDLPDLAISSSAKYNIFLTVKELMHNIVKSSNCTMANLQILFQANFLNIQVSDNGAGMDVKTIMKNRTKSYGLHKCVQWMGELQGQIVWNKPLEGTGTEVQIKLPLGALKT